MTTAQPELLNVSAGQFSVATRRQKSTLAERACSCSALADGSGAQAAALAAFATLNTACGSATAAVNQNQLGPYGDNGSCHHGCSYEQTWWWKINFQYVNSNLVSVVSMLNAGSAYNAASQLTQQWVSSGLPDYNTLLTGGIQVITQTDAAIGQAGGQETPAQAAQLAAAFSAALTALQHNLADMNQGLQGIASFVTQQNPNNGYLLTYATSCQSSITTSGTALENNLIGKISCGAGDVQNSFNNMFSDVATKLANMQGSFNTVNANFYTALQAVQGAAGIFLTLQSDNSLVSQYLAQAQALAPTSPLRTLRLNMAASVWAGLLAEATTQLSA